MTGDKTIIAFITKGTRWYGLPVILATVLCVSLTSCFKEKPIKPPLIITEAVHVADMGLNYTQQLYFNIQTGIFVDSNSKYAYDMAFDCQGYNYFAYTNTANFSSVCRTGRTDFHAVSLADTVAGWRIEYGSGIADSNAIGQWQTNLVSNKQVYIIRRGEDSVGNSLGIVKMQMGDFVSNSYSVTFANMDNSNMHTVSVPRQSSKNLVFLSFNNGGTVQDLEPVNTNWDFLFTQYCVYFGPPNNIPYKVTGLLTNPAQTYAYFMDSTTAFDSITLKSVNNSLLQPTNPHDNIGYGWKRFNGVSYTELSNYNYIIKSGNGQYFKMRFLDFYNANGVKGYPKFQYYLLQ